MRFRLIAALTALTGLAVVSGCSAEEGTSKEIRAEIAAHDPAEVKMLREQAKANGIAADDQTILTTLQARDDCRIIRAALIPLSRGAKSDPAVAKLTQLPALNRDRGQSEQAKYFQTLVDKALLGDVSEVKGYHDQNCADVK